MEKLLFIDDDLDFLESNRIYFTRKGYKVYQCSSPKEAWELLQNTAFEIFGISAPKDTPAHALRGTAQILLWYNKFGARLFLHCQYAFSFRRFCGFHNPAR